MKKILVIAALIVASVATALASNSFKLDNSDTLRIHPSRLSGYWQTVVTMTNDAYVDNWLVAIQFPDGIAPKLVAGATPLSGMVVPYIGPDGKEYTCECPLNVSAEYATVTSRTSGYGYWDYNADGVFEPYGSVKWLPTTHEMWRFNLYIDTKFREGDIIFDGTLDASQDSRGPILSNVKTYNRIHLWVGYRPGDVTGDNLLTVGDASLIIAYLLLDEDERETYWSNEFSAAAADYDRDGYVTMGDVGKIIKAALVQHFD
jgi:hypothetical protein